MSTLSRRPRSPSRSRLALLDRLINAGCYAIIVGTLGFFVVVCLAVAG